MSLRERLMRVPTAGVVNGAGLFLALARLEELRRGSVAEYSAKTAASSLPRVPEAVAFVGDFTIEDHSALASELFTATAVGTMIVGLAKSEGVVIDDDVRGLGVRLEVSISPALASLLGSFSECLDKAALVVTGWRAAGELALAE